MPIKQDQKLAAPEKRLEQKPKLTPEEVEAARKQLKKATLPKTPIQLGEIGRHQIDF